MKLRTCGLVVSAAFVVACVLGSASAQFYQQGPKLVGAGAIDLSEQGGSVALSGDGSTAIFGGPDDNGGTGAAWVYTRSNGVWTQQAKLVGTGAIGNASQGASVSLSGDGNTAIIGGPNDNGFNGAAWVFTRSGGVWSQQAKLIATDAIRLPTQGRSVSLSHDGNTAIVGGPDDNFGLGAAWVFTRSGGVWTQQAKLVGTGAIGPGGGQGTSVSLSGDGNTAIVGEPRPNGSAGAAWVFTRSGGVWGQQQQLVGTGAVPGSCLGPSQGASVSLSDDGSTAIVGGPLDDGTQEHCSGAIGAAWVFTRSGGVWSQQGPKLVGSGALPEAGQQGRSVSLSGDGNTAIIGGPFGSLSGNSIGAAWVFTRPSGVWSQQQKLVGTGVVGSAGQGSSVALSGDGNTAIVGGPFDNNTEGAAWVFAPFAGTPGTASCFGLSTSTLVREFGGINAAAAGTGFSSIRALQDAIMAYCDGSGQVASTLP